MSLNSADRKSVNDNQESSSSVSDSQAAASWVSVFCSVFAHQYFVEVSEDYIRDDFNLTGLSAAIPYHYKAALEIILDLEPSEKPNLHLVPAVEQAAEKLYGLIHARYILTRHGLQAMAAKYEKNMFGSCPRYYCDGMGLLPVGRSDIPDVEIVKLYCPCCMDIYVPPHSRYMNIDGAFFGTSFAGLFIKTFPDIEKQCEKRRWKQYDLKIFGFKINERSQTGPRMKWLRQKPREADEDESLTDSKMETE